MIAGISGKFAGELGLRLLRQNGHIPISWQVAMASVFIGTFSHVAIDSIMHADVMPFFPFSTRSLWHGLLGIDQLNLACLVTGILGAALYWWTEQPRRRADKA